MFSFVAAAECGDSETRLSYSTSEGSISNRPGGNKKSPVADGTRRRLSSTATELSPAGSSDEAPSHPLPMTRLITRPDPGCLQPQKSPAGSSDEAAKAAHECPTSRPRLSSSAADFSPAGSREAPATAHDVDMTRRRLSSTAKEFNPGSSEAPTAHGPTRPGLSSTSKEFSPGMSTEAPTAHGDPTSRPRLSSTAAEFSPAGSNKRIAHHQWVLKSSYHGSRLGAFCVFELALE